MTAIAQATSDEDIAAAAEWFAALKTPATPWIKVIEQNTVPKTYLGQGRMRFIDPDVKTTEPIGNRIIMLPMDTKRARLRDPRSGAGFQRAGAGWKRRQGHCEIILNIRENRGSASPSLSRAVRGTNP